MEKYFRVFLAFVLISFCTTFLISCKQTSQNNSDIPLQTTADTVESSNTLKFRITWKAYSGRGEAIDKIVNSYNERGKNPYKVALVDGDEALDTIQTSLKEEPDKDGSVGSIDIYMLPYRYVRYLGATGMLEDLTADFTEEKDLIYENIWKLATVDNKVYGIPWLGHTMGLIYNKNLLDKAGVDPSSIKDLDSLVKAFESVETTTDAKGMGLVGAEHNDVSWMVNQFIYGFGGSLVSEDGSQVTINSKESEAALEFYKNILGAHAQPTWKTDTGVEVMDAFRNQSIAFEIQGLWGITDIWKNGNLFETGVIPLDSIGLYPEVGPMMVALPAGLDKNKRDAAIDFIRYLITDKAQEQIMDGEYSPEHDAYYPFRLPVRKDSTENAFFIKYPEFTKFLSGYNKPSIDVPVPLWQEVKDKYYAPGLHKVMENNLSIKDFLKMIEEEGNKILNSQN